MNTINKYWIVVLVIIIIVLSGLLWYSNLTKESRVSETLTENIKSADVQSSQAQTSLEVESWKIFRDTDLGISFSYPKEWGKPEIDKLTDSFGIIFPDAYKTDYIQVVISGRSPSYIEDGPDRMFHFCKDVSGRELKPGVFLSYEVLSSGEPSPTGVLCINLIKKYPNISITENFYHLLHYPFGEIGGYFSVNEFNESNLKKFFFLQNKVISDFEKFGSSFESI